MNHISNPECLWLGILYTSCSVPVLCADVILAFVLLQRRTLRKKFVNFVVLNLAIIDILDIVLCNLTTWTDFKIFKEGNYSLLAGESLYVTMILAHQFRKLWHPSSLRKCRYRHFIVVAVIAYIILLATLMVNVVDFYLYFIVFYHMLLFAFMAFVNVCYKLNGYTGRPNSLAGFYNRNVELSIANTFLVFWSFPVVNLTMVHFNLYDGDYVTLPLAALARTYPLFNLYYLWKWNEPFRAALKELLFTSQDDGSGNYVSFSSLTDVFTEDDV